MVMILHLLGTDYNFHAQQQNMQHVSALRFLNLFGLDDVPTVDATV